jgi:hypothetical protein
LSATGRTGEDRKTVRRGTLCHRRGRGAQSLRKKVNTANYLILGTEAFSTLVSILIILGHLAAKKIYSLHCAGSY